MQNQANAVDARSGATDWLGGGSKMRMICCLPELRSDLDVPFSVSRDLFLQYFDQEDYLRDRDSRYVIPAYLANWFHTAADGALVFEIPTVQFVRGKTVFISGRHRTAVLWQYITEVPMAFEDTEKEKHHLISRMALPPLAMHEFIKLPDLPMRERLP